MSPTRTMEIKEEEQLAAIQAAMRGAAPRLYTNSIAFAQTASDISLILLHNGATIGVLSMSHITAKSLATDLSKTMADFEKATGETIKQINEIVSLLQKEQTKG